MKTNFLKFLTLLLFSSILVISCKEDKVEPDYTGKWVGVYGETSNNFTLFLKSNGDIGVIDGLGAESEIQASGTYTINGDNFTSTYTYSASFGGATYSLAGLISKNASGKYILTGTYGSGTSTTGGEFEVVKE